MSEKSRKRNSARSLCKQRKRNAEAKCGQRAHFIEDFGIEGDAHAGKWHRQVSLLSHDKIEAFRAKRSRSDRRRFRRESCSNKLGFSLFSGRNTAYMPRCDLRDDADRKRVSSRVSYFSEDGRVHYAERRCFCKSDPRRRDQNRRYYVRREKWKVSSKRSFKG